MIKSGRECCLSILVGALKTSNFSNGGVRFPPRLHKTVISGTEFTIRQYFAEPLADASNQNIHVDG